MGTTVTCPILRYHPAVVAEAFASLSLLYPERVFLGLGSGEALNEEAATGQWPVLVEQFVVVGDKDDVQTAARLWNFIPKAFKGYQNIPSPVTIEQRAAAEIPLTQVYADWPVSTDPKVHIQAIEKLFASGVTIVNIHSGQPDQHVVLDFYAAHVLPRIKSSQSTA